MIKFISSLWIVVLSLFLTGCNSGISQKTSPATTNYPISSQISLANVGIIPLIADNADHKVYLRLHNNSNEAITRLLLSAPLISLPVDLTNCEGLAAKSSCLIALTLPAKLKTGGQILRLKVITASHQQYEVSQFIRYAVNNQQNPLQLGQLPDLIIQPQAGVVSVTIPFTTKVGLNQLMIESLANTYTSEIICDKDISLGRIEPATMCSAIITLSRQNQVNTITFNALTASGSKASASVSINSTLNNLANLIASPVNPLLTATESIQLITLYNSGTNLASGLDIAAPTPLQITNNTCGNSLASGTTCSFSITNTGNLNGQSSVSINYNDGSSNTALVVNVGYIVNPASPLLQITQTGSLTNLRVGESQTAVFTISNNGDTTLTNLKLPAISSVDSGLQYTTSSVASPVCALDGSQSLSVAASCNIGISYAPTTITSGSFYLNPVASYVNNYGNSLTYASTSQQVVYSAVIASRIYAANSRGLVFYESATLPGTVAIGPDGSSITVESNINGVIYVGTASSNVYSYDTSATYPSWVWVGNASLGAGTIRALVNVGNKLYAGTNSDGVYSINLANTSASWSAVGITLLGRSVTGLTVIGNTVYAATSSGQVYHSTVADWATSGSSTGSISSLSSYTNVLLLTTGSTVKYMPSGGSSWSTLGASLPSSFSGLVNIAVVGDTVYVINGRNVYSYNMQQGYNGVWSIVTYNAPLCGSSSSLYSIRADGTSIYTGCTDGNVYSHDAQTFNYVWVSLGSPVASAINSLLAISQQLYVTSTDGNLYAYDLQQANPVWSKRGSLALDGSSVLAQVGLGNKLYAATANGNVFSFDLISPGATWQQLGSTVDSAGIYSLTLLGNKIIAGSGDSTIYSYDTTASSPTWTMLDSKIGSGQYISYGLTTIGSKIYVALGAATFAYVDVYDTSEANPSWLPVSGGSVASISLYNIAAIGNNLYSGSYAGDVRTYNILTGGSSWSNLGSQPDGQSVYSLIAVGNILYSGTYAGGVFKYDTSLGSPSWVRLCQSNIPDSGQIWSLAYLGSKIYAGSSKGNVYTCDTSLVTPSWQLDTGLSNYALSGGSAQINSLVMY